MNYPKPDKIENMPGAASAPVYISVPQYRKYRKHKIEAAPSLFGGTTAGGLSPGVKAAIGVGVALVAGLVVYEMFKRRNR